MTIQYPWYVKIEGDELQQGDILDGCSVPIPTMELFANQAGEIPFEVYDVVIITQSCDLENDKVDWVLVCPLWSLSEFSEGNDFFKSTQGKNNLRQGNVPGYHMVNSCDLPEFAREIRVVDFHISFSIPLAYAREFAQKNSPRLRLLPPYREHLAQAFARFYMRVGLPSNIPPFRKETK